MQAGDDPRRKSREPQPGAKPRAKLAGQDAESHAFLAATEAAGLQLGTDHARANHKIICVSTALKEFQQYGPDIYTEGLRAITEAWEGDPNSLRAGIMQGVMRFIALYKDVYGYERLVKRLATVYPMKLVRDAGRHERRGVVQTGRFKSVISTRALLAPRPKSGLPFSR